MYLHFMDKIIKSGYSWKYKVKHRAMVSINQHFLVKMNFKVESLKLKIKS